MQFSEDGREGRKQIRSISAISASMKIYHSYLYFFIILLNETFWFTSNQKTVSFHINSLIACNPIPQYEYNFKSEHKY